MRAAILLALITVAIAGCYSPAPRSGSYLCADDGSCPTGLVCSSCAGVCISRASDDVCSLRVELTAPPACTPAVADACVTEGSDLTVTVTALGAGGVASTYSGPATLSATWGHARPQPRRDGDPFSFHIERGAASITVRLDRATPKNATAQIGARVGRTAGVSYQSVIVDPRPFKSPESILAPGDSSWADTFIGFAAVDRTPGGEYRMYVSGMTNPLNVQKPARARIGVATSPTAAANSWALGVAPLFSDDNAHLFGPSALRLPDGSVRLFASSYPVNGKGDPAGSSSIQAAMASDGITFGPLAPVLTHEACTFCNAKGGLLHPWAILSPNDTGEWLLFFSTVPADATSMGVARTLDRGTSWHISSMPVPSSGQAGPGAQVAIAARVVFDRRDGIYRMWYAENADPGALLFDPCKSSIGYATSEDGLFFSGARRVVLPLSDVKWAPAPSVGLYPGAVLPTDDGGWQIYFSPVVNLVGVCLPLGVGRALD